MKAEGMKVRRLKIQHFKKIKNVDIYARAFENEISGPNEAGKSTILDAIKTAIGGAKLSPDKPLTEGKPRGEIYLELDGGLEITRSFKEGSGMVTKIHARDGSKWGQRGLDDLLSAFTIDPLEFSRMDKKKQTEVIEKLAGQSHIDKASFLNAQYDESFGERAYEKRKLAEMGQPEPVKPCEPVDGRAIAEEYNQAVEHNAEQEKRQVALGKLRDYVEQIENEIDQLQAAINKKKEELSSAESVFRGAKLPAPVIDTAPIKERLQAVVETNTRANAYRDYQQNLKKIEQQKARVEELESKVKVALEAKLKHAEAVELPVEGLTWGADGIRVNGLPWDQLASSAKINISARIGMAAKSGLKIMLVQDGALLDDKKFVELVELARAHDYQLWIETVDRAHSAEAIWLSDGAIIQTPAINAGETAGVQQ